MTSTCDNTSVGVIVADGHGKYLLFDRNTFPPGAAPPAGHVDDHGSYEDAARAEVNEETGLTVVSLRYVAGGWRNNKCRREPGPKGPGHQWRVYLATVTGDLVTSPRETRNARWLDQQDIQALAARTVEYAYDTVTALEFAENPGIEPVWVRWLEDVRLIVLPDNCEGAVELLAEGRIQ